MTKIFINDPAEDWIVDRMRAEFYADNLDLCTFNLAEADTIWLMAGWCWDQMSELDLKEKHVTVSEHHIPAHKWDKQRQYRFKIRDQFTNQYHVPCQITHDIIRSFTKKPIHIIPYWVNPKIWYNLTSLQTELVSARDILMPDLPADCLVVGSFQRDTEGNSKKPKLEKGPDLFCDIIEDVKHQELKPHVLLGGWRRAYVCDRLTKADISFTLLEKMPLETVNLMYNACDLYIVASRDEGGPQAILECALTKTPVISTRVGVAEYFLKDISLFNAPDWYTAIPSKFNYTRVKESQIPYAFKRYRRELFGVE